MIYVGGRILQKEKRIYKAQGGLFNDVTYMGLWDPGWNLRKYYASERHLRL